MKAGQEGPCEPFLFVEDLWEEMKAHLIIHKQTQDSTNVFQTKHNYRKSTPDKREENNVFVDFSEDVVLVRDSELVSIVHNHQSS